MPSNVERLNGGAFRSARSVSLNTRPRASLNGNGFGGQRLEGVGYQLFGFFNGNHARSD